MHPTPHASSPIHRAHHGKQTQTKTPPIIKCIHATGTLCLRFQPLGAEEPLCFADVKASPRVRLRTRGKGGAERCREVERGAERRESQLCPLEKACILTLISHARASSPLHRPIERAPPPPLSKQTAGDVTLRLCGFTTEQGLGAFATLPLAKHVSGAPPPLLLPLPPPPPCCQHACPPARPRAITARNTNIVATTHSIATTPSQHHHNHTDNNNTANTTNYKQTSTTTNLDTTGKRAQVGVRYSSPDVAAGAIAQPATNTLAAAWLVGRYGGVTAGLQLRPDIDLGAPGRALQGACRDAGGWSEWLRSVSSFALAYSPDGGRGREARSEFVFFLFFGFASRSGRRLWRSAVRRRACFFLLLLLPPFVSAPPHGPSPLLPLQLAHHTLPLISLTALLPPPPKKTKRARRPPQRAAASRASPPPSRSPRAARSSRRSSSTWRRCAR